VAAIESGRLPAPRPQDASQVTWAPEPTGDLSGVRWTWATERILRRLRALSPSIGLALEFGGVAFFATRAVAAESYPRALVPGEGALWGDPPHLVVRTGDSAIRITRAAVVEKSGDAVSVDGSELARRLSSRPAKSDRAPR
jgi:methionyl-tRNA formyltransferase